MTSQRKGGTPMEKVFLTINFDEEADRGRVEEVTKQFSGIHLFKQSVDMFFSGDKTHGEALLFQLGKLGYKMNVLH